MEKHSLLTECNYKPSDKWEYGFHTTCEAFVYYFPYDDKVPTKCVSKRDVQEVKAELKLDQLDYPDKNLISAKVFFIKI